MLSFLRMLPRNCAEDMLLAQDDYVQGVARAHKEACELNGRKHLKDERLRELLKAPHLRRVPARPGSKGAGAGGSGGDAGGGCVPMPLDPTVLVRTVTMVPGFGYLVGSTRIGIELSRFE